MAVPIESILTPDVINILTTLVVPFGLFFTVLLVGIKNTRVFGDNKLIYIILSLALTFMIYAYDPGHIFEGLGNILVQIGVSGVVIVMTGTIILIFWTLISKSFSAAADLTRNFEAKSKELEKKRAQLLVKAYRERNVEKRARMESELLRLERDIQYLQLKNRKRV